MPDLFLKLDELIKRGDLETARELQFDINLVIYKMCEGHGNLYAMIKEILRINENLDIGSVRAPLEPLNTADLDIAAEAAGMIRSTREKYII